jgi:hypothetical protein
MAQAVRQWRVTTRPVINPSLIHVGRVVDKVWLGHVFNQVRQFSCHYRFTKTLYLFFSHHHYTGCPRRNVPDFGRVFLMLKYTDITQNTYVQS